MVHALAGAVFIGNQDLQTQRAIVISMNDPKFVQKTISCYTVGEADESAAIFHRE